MPLAKINPQETKSWKKLQSHYEEIKTISLREQFTADKDRFQRFSIRWGDFLFDYSKNLIIPETMELLLALAEECKVKESIVSMFNGEKINETENRAVLHTALRNRSENPVFVDNKDVMPAIRRELQRMKEFSDKVRSGEWRGYTRKAVTDIVNIGIGGSDLGPVMVCEALKHYGKTDLKMHFVSNIDGTHIYETLKELNAETTLFLVASKTFTTQETMTNAETARQ